MPVFFQSRAGRQCVSIVVSGVTLWLLGTLLQLDDSLVAFMTGFGEYGADKLVLALGIAGAMSFVYSVLRIADLRKEMELRAAAQAKADWTATHDHLTKLPNRYAFERKILSRPIKDDEAEIEEWDRNVTIFCVDLDGFKKVNDLVGHKGGDILLIEVARRICALGNADCVYRFGGDEFIIVAFALTAQREERFAKLLIQAVTRPIHIDGFAVEVGASVGYDRWAEGAEPLEDAAHRADLAMYEAKSRGPNHYFVFEASMQNKVTERASLETRLRAAISNKAIKPFYQPLIDLKTGQLCGFEALARWIGDDTANIPPPVFIGIAEENGMITALFEDLLAQACSDALAWPEHVMLSFNVSPVQMEDRLLTSRILKVLSASRLPPQRLEVEITENALIQDPAAAAAILDELHAAGIQIALDDFGTGYSSLAQLARYRFDKIKIDKSFIATYRDDERQEEIVRAMLGLGRSLNIKTTAEGIEEHGQLAFLLQLGCDIGQGYLFGKAMPATEASTFISDRKTRLAFTA
ncbi:putative bifunctional diguanylate cyclase/phosphodiesterase [Rhizobium laguerreae]|uniref:putative bifunctional diguanylate cyclase/phosphodiesterase n=1 Tax=Rhizobium laguerreae TaxID=1076926 RepID=UPI001C91D005|nr:bifunctional diguanylate cyclase/phosphodiesterase [Rhizobium laguerreae]MBY3197813.1 bifunctional diguanylate cyclase/phosphodiesterase [Rhizobium laguerreae]MBY3231303.1 bifunctional diguanylate cyclase/phosphodiesterase [Rhizobium laguerreae]MBY3561999.1 bifunctional diguanylate cyclase/phosphodiesterase [Rhizobium laguerreae]